MPPLEMSRAAVARALEALRRPCQRARATSTSSPEKDLERGNLLGPSLSSRVSDVYFPELMDEERSKCRKLWLLHPDGARYHIWQLAILVLVAFCAVWTPFEFGFVPSPTPAIMYLDLAVNLMFMLDIAFTFTSAFHCPKSLQLITSRRAISKRYLLSGFFPDVLSTTPYNIICFWATGAPAAGALGTVFRALACLRLYRLPRVYHEFSLLGRSSYSTFLTIRLAKLLLNIILAAHYAAVLYFWITTLEPDPQATWIVAAMGPTWQTQPIFLQYVATMWWSIFVITSIGPAYVASTVPEQIFNCLYALFGMAALSYTLGTLTLIMVKSSSNTMEYHEDLAALRAFAVRNDLPPDLEKQLRDQLQLRLLQKKSETESFLANLPRHLRVAVTRHLHLPVVERIPDFQGCSQAFLNQLVASCELEVVTRSTIVTLAGDIATHLFIVVSGKLVREKPEETPGGPTKQQPLLLPGSVFGKTAVLCDVPQLFTVRALETSQLLRLCKKDFKAIMEVYPDDCTRVLNKLKAKLEPNNQTGHSSPEISALSRSMSEEALQGSIASVTRFSRGNQS